MSTPTQTEINQKNHSGAVRFFWGFLIGATMVSLFANHRGLLKTEARGQNQRCVNSLATLRPAFTVPANRRSIGDLNAQGTRSGSPG